MVGVVLNVQTPHIEHRVYTHKDVIVVDGPCGLRTTLSSHWLLTTYGIYRFSTVLIKSGGLFAVAL
ncbi:hypothetical protein METHB2_140001 [Candidatus Methylobacter favarea]|uniref:Uncharacterized protein n=1 Tax=Candidatus Methylobacter favarea TaxID=2707345 RepID=A0A8S0W993_9GAMM|nr:hypothetical protein METHB2_140001 [Candidatus Methylobacter favarea]